MAVTQDLPGKRGLGSRFSFQQKVDAAPEAVGVCGLVPQHVSIQKDCWRTRYTHRLSALNIGTYPLVNLVAFHILFELVRVEIELPGIRNENRTRIFQFGPLFLVEI